jgi:thiazole synthase ThiGH ThiG subunit
MVIVASLVAGILVPLAIGIAPVPTHNSLTVFQAKRAAILVFIAISMAAAAIAEARLLNVATHSGWRSTDSGNVDKFLSVPSTTSLLC